VHEAEGKQTEQELTNAINLLKPLTPIGHQRPRFKKRRATRKIAVYNLEQESANNRRAINKADKKADSEGARFKAIAATERTATKERLEGLRAIAKLKKEL
jgi:hypothetical protein